MSTAARLSSLIAGHVAARADRERRSHEASWQLATTGAERWEQECAKAEKEIVQVLSDPDVYRTLVEFRDGGRLEDAGLQRQLDILLLDTGRCQGDEATLSELVDLAVKAETVYANFRPTLDGEPVSENRIREILRESRDEDERRRAWETSKTIGPTMAPLILEMVEKRNRIARALGHRDYYAMDLAHQEIEEGFLFDVLDQLLEDTREPYDRMLDELFGRIAGPFGLSKEDVRPWHLADPFFQEAVPDAGLPIAPLYEGKDLVEITRRYFTSIGLDIEEVIRRSDLFPREGKNQHAFCSHVDRTGDDVRVLCNVIPDDYWMDTMLHEFGHAVYDTGLDGGLPWLLRQAAHTLSTEAIALLFGRLATDPDWMIAHAGIPATDVDPLREALRESARMKQLVFPRWVMVMAHFERALYADPSADLNDVWWGLVERFQGVPRPEGREGAADWACKVHIPLAPVYYHNYLLGDLMASQLQAFLQAEAGGEPWFAPAGVGPRLRETLFRHGAVHPWNETLRRVTGEGLDPGHYVAQYVTAP